MNSTNIVTNHGLRGQGVTGASDSEVQLTLLASQNSLYLTNLMSEVASIGLFSLSLAFGKHNSKTAVCDIACTVV